MRIEAVNPETGVVKSGEAEYLYQSTIEELNSCQLTERAIKKKIDNLGISADWKKRLHDATHVTIKAGPTILWIGRKVLEQVLILLETFKWTSLGLILGYVVGWLIAAIPFIGWALGPLVTPILMVVFGGQGLIEDIKHMFDDIKDKLLRDKVEETRARFSSLRTR